MSTSPQGYRPSFDFMLFLWLVFTSLVGYIVSGFHFVGIVCGLAAGLGLMFLMFLFDLE